MVFANQSQPMFNAKNLLLLNILMGIAILAVAWSSDNTSLLAVGLVNTTIEFFYG